MLKPFDEAIAERVLVCDGAMGTMLYAKGVFINKSFDALNLAAPDHVDESRAGAAVRQVRKTRKRENTKHETTKGNHEGTKARRRT